MPPAEMGPDCAIVALPTPPLSSLSGCVPPSGAPSAGWRRLPQQGLQTYHHTTECSVGAHCVSTTEPQMTVVAATIVHVPPWYLLGTSLVPKGTASPCVHGFCVQR